MIKNKTLLSSLFMLALAASLSWFSLSNSAKGFGSLDFKAYWVAAHTLSEGKNPYNKIALLAEERRLFPDFEHYIPVWNPPWAFSLLLPLTLFSLSSATFLMMTLNIFLLLPISNALQSIFYPTNSLYMILAAILFVPAWEVVEYGQLSTVLTAALAFGLVFFLKEQNFQAGLCFSLLSIKPHLGYLLSFAIVIKSLSERRLGFFAGGVLGAAILVAIALITEPHSFVWWLEAAKPLEFEATTFITFLREALAPLIGKHNAHLTWLIPLCTCLLSLPFILRNRQLTTLISPLLCISAFLAPYGWIFDQVMMIFVPLELVSRLRHSQYPKRIHLEIWAWQIALFAWRFSYRLTPTNQADFCFFALGLLMVWIRCNHLLLKISPRPPKFNSSVSLGTE